MPQRDLAHFRYEIQSVYTFAGCYLTNFIATTFLGEGCLVFLATADLSDLISVRGYDLFRKKKITSLSVVHNLYKEIF